MKITAIKAQVKNPDRVSIYIDEKYAFSLNHSQLLEQRLHSGLEVTDARLAELKNASDLGRAYERALMYVMLRPRSVRELQQYARRKQWSPETTQIIIEKLQAKKYVNDASFAKAWVRSRQMTKAISTRKLQLELKQKGVSSEDIAAALADANYDELDALKTLVAKKRKLTRFAADDQKLMQYLARQGFGFDDIKQALQ